MDKKTAIRSITALIVAVFDLLKVFGIFSIGSGIPSTVIYCIVSIGVGIWIWWKNNNITEIAKYSQDILDNIKKGVIQIGETIEIQIYEK